MLKKFTINGLIGVLSGLLGLLNYFVFIYFEGLAALGVWATVSIIIVLSQFVEYGLTDGVFKQVASKEKEHKTNKIEFISTAIIVFSAIGMCLGIFLYLNLDNFFELTKVDTVKWDGVDELYRNACICIFLSALTSCLRAVLYGLNLHTQTNCWMLICRIVQTASLIYFIYQGFSFHAQAISLLAYLILMIVGCLYLIFKDSFGSFDACKIRYLTVHNVKLLFSTSKEMFIIKTGQKVFVDEAFKILLARYAGPEAIGAYSTAFNLAQLYRNTVDLGSKVLLNSSIDESLVQLRISLIKMFKFVLAPLSFIAILSVLSFKYIINDLQLFSDYVLIYYYLVPLVIAYSINVFATPLYYILIGTGKFKILFQTLIISIFTLYFSLFILKNFPMSNIQFGLFTINVIPYFLMIIVSSLFIIKSSFKILTPKTGEK